MTLIAYLKDKRLNILYMCIGTFILEFYLYIFNINMFLKGLTAIVCSLMCLIPVGVEYIRKEGFYMQLVNTAQQIDQKYLFTELIGRPSFLEGKIFFDLAVEVNHNMGDQMNQYKQNIREYKEYIELWVHEAKTPVATAKLIGENNPNNKVIKSIEEEVERIESLIEQVLYYSKIDTVEEDYKITTYNLKEMVHKVIIQNKKELIGNKIKVDLYNLDNRVQTDSKWVCFIMNQIIINSIKYGRKQDATIEIYSEVGHEKIKLCIKDNGIGIKEDEVKKVFQKGFVGTNGRRQEASTGMGLYICKKLMDKLHHGFMIESKEGEGTVVTLIFPISNHMLLKSENK